MNKSRFSKICLLALLIFCLSVHVAKAAPPKDAENGAKTSNVALSPQLPPLTPVQVKQLESRIAGATDVVELNKVAAEVDRLKTSLAISPETARPMLLTILAKEKAKAPNSLAVARSLTYIARTYSVHESLKSVPYQREALKIVEQLKDAPVPFKNEVKSALAKELVLAKAPRAEVLSVVPPCPKCQNKTNVVPVFGFVPFNPASYNFAFVKTIFCGAHPDWYCRKCTASFFPYQAHDESIIDEKVAR